MYLFAATFGEMFVPFFFFNLVFIFLLLSFEVFKNIYWRSFHCGAAEMNPTSIHEDAGSIPGLTQWVKDPALL